MPLFLVLLILVSCIPASAQTRAGDMARLYRETAFDPQECYRVRDMNLIKEDLRLFFNEGFLIFAKPVNGLSHAALFVAETEGGDGEVLVLPPYRGERLSLSNFVGSPNLDEHIGTALMLFTDDTAATLAASVQEQKSRRSPDMGLLLAQKWNSVLRNFTGSLEIRLVDDTLAEHSPNGFFYAALMGAKLNNFDVVYDPRNREQIMVGQVVFRNDHAFFDTWASFESRSYRKGDREPSALNYSLSGIRINAQVEPNLHMKSSTRATLQLQRTSASPMAFEISRRMRITSVTIDGEPAEPFQRESLRANLVRGSDNELFLVVPAHAIGSGKPHEIVFEHEGDVISDAGNRVFFVGARGTWYPHIGAGFSTYDITFRYPKDLSLVSTGDVTDDRTDGDWRITTRKTATPIRFAGFNLGDYEKAVVAKGLYQVEVYANRHVETALQPRPRDSMGSSLPPPWLRGPPRNSDLSGILVPQAPPDPVGRLRQLAAEVSGALEFMTGIFGPPPLKTLTVSPIPGAFGQGFPGLLYLSTLAYINPSERPMGSRSAVLDTFYAETMPAHETAHQWWGNIVTSAGYQDEWIMESLSNYSALLYLEKHKGGRSLDSTLDSFKKQLLAKGEDGRTFESAGPIVWGIRLQNSQAPLAWTAITYSKGAWIIHMLRRRLGDDKFFAMLAALRKEYAQRTLNTDQFQKFVAGYLQPKSTDPKLENFFEQWVYSTGIPTLKLTHQVKGKAPNLKLTATITQSDVDEDFSAEVPVQIQIARGKPMVVWMKTANEPVSITIPLKQAPTKVSLDSTGVLAR